MKQLTTSSLKQGYITIPRALLNRQATDGAAGETEAFLQILAHTNYSDVPYDINGTIILCKRGDSLISYHHWSNIFGWTRPKTTRFFQRLAKGGIIDLIPHQEKILHIRITNFDLWTGRIPSEAKDARKVARGRREWNKLTREEQQLAIDRIEDVYYHTNDTRFIAHASTYLKDKAFLNEYMD